jgi:hypothetical protein
MEDAFSPSWLLSWLFKLVILRTGSLANVILIHQEVGFLLEGALLVKWDEDDWMNLLMTILQKLQ